MSTDSVNPGRSPARPGGPSIGTFQVVPPANTTASRPGYHAGAGDLQLLLLGVVIAVQQQIMPRRLLGAGAVDEDGAVAALHEAVVMEVHPEQARRHRGLHDGGHDVEPRPALPVN